MFTVQTHHFGASLESTFPSAVLYSQAHVEQIAAKMFGNFEMQGLAAEQIKLAKQNDLYDYELSFSLLNGNVTFSLNARRATLAFNNAAVSQDVTTIFDMTVRCFGSLPLPEGTLHRAVGHTHFSFDAPQGFAEYFSPKETRWSEVDRLGITAFLVEDGWTDEIRVGVEPSGLLPAGGFAMPSTIFRAPVISADLLVQIQTVFEQSLRRCQLEFKPLL